MISCFNSPGILNLDILDVLWLRKYKPDQYKIWMLEIDGMRELEKIAGLC